MLERDFGQQPENLANEEVVMRILARGKPGELECLRNFHNLTEDQVKIFSYYVKLRQIVIEQMKPEADRREKENPFADEDELNMGCYREDLEPQVREAVLNLRRKGYSTYESGFSGLNGQRISFEQEHLNNFNFPKEFIQQLDGRGINLKVEPNAICLDCNKEFNLEELRNIWLQVEGCIPALPNRAEPCKLPAAVSFRQRQKI